jgi:hypothetical protein
MLYYALCAQPLIACKARTMNYALCTMNYELCTMNYELSKTMNYAL